MTVTARLEDVAPSVEPGTTATVGVTVHNGGHQVEAYQLQVVGEPAGWATVQPAELHVYPGEEQHADLVLAPPRASSVPAGVRPFGVRVAGTEDPGDVAVPEGRVEVLPYADVSIELTPRTSHGRGRARHELAVDNRGNAPVPLAVIGDDPDEAVAVTAQPAELTVPPGEAAFVRIRVRAARRRWTGPPATRPFRVAARSRGEALTVDGAMLQEAVLPKWLGKAVAAAVALALLLTIAWLALLRPVVRTAAQDAVQAPVAAVRATADRASKSAAAANTNAGAAGRTAAQAGTAAGKAAAGTKALGDKLVEKRILTRGDVASSGASGSAGAGGAAAVPGTSFSQRLESEVAAAATRQAPFTVPSRQVVSITDVFFENSQGDTGSVRVLVGDKVLFRKSLANFRDLDDHFVTPIALAAGDTVTFETACGKAGAGAPGGLCRTALLLVGSVAVLAAG
jgi:hypothetical protein